MKKSIIIRGSVFYDKHPQNFINEVVNSIRSWFCDQIILSTWEGQEKYIDKNLAVDKVVLTPDPGPGPIQHWNRQVLSYQRGLEVSEGEKIMVTRSDMIHKKDPFGYLDVYPNSTDNLKVFSNKLIVSNMMTIRPDSNEYPNCFRICDWFQVGYKNDIIKWSDVMESILTFDQTKINESTCTETLWFLSVLKNKFGNMINIYDSSNIDKFAWDAIVNNFIILDTKSTLHAVNSNWDFQPEYCPCYLNEETYKELYGEVNK